jgi:hypothetical protein
MADESEEEKLPKNNGKILNIDNSRQYELENEDVLNLINAEKKAEKERREQTDKKAESDRKA